LNKLPHWALPQTAAQIGEPMFSLCSNHVKNEKRTTKAGRRRSAAGFFVASVCL
jgi:hypothetical protein